MLSCTGLKVGLQAGDERVVLVADRGVRVVEHRRRACSCRLVGQIERRRVLVHGDRPARDVGGIDAEQFSVGDRARQHDVREQRVDDHHVLQRIPLLLGNVLEVENSVEGKDKSVVRTE
jgi:hypothetical protein